MLSTAWATGPPSPIQPSVLLKSSSAKCCTTAGRGAGTGVGCPLFLAYWRVKKKNNIPRIEQTKVCQQHQQQHQRVPPNTHRPLMKGRSSAVRDSQNSPGSTSGTALLPTLSVYVWPYRRTCGSSLCCALFQVDLLLVICLFLQHAWHRKTLRSSGCACNDTTYNLSWLLS